VNVVAGISIIIVLFLLFIWLSIEKPESKHTQNNISTPSIPIPFSSCISEVSWEEVEIEFTRLALDKQREISRMQQAYEELLDLQPTPHIGKSFTLHYHLNEKNEFIDVFAQEDEDFYTEYMIDHEEWHNILAYNISGESLGNYTKPTLVCATLYSITTAGYSSLEILQKKRAHTG
jgi:hypothetical protein